MDVLHRSANSPFHAGIKCAVLRNTPPTDGQAVLSCARARGVSALWLGTLLSLALFAYRAYALRRVAGQPPPKEPFAWYIALLPFFLASAYMFVLPMLALGTFEADREAYVQSKLSPTEWLTARNNDERTQRTTNTSILCACIVASAGFLNSQLAYSRSMAAAAAAAAKAKTNAARAPALTPPSASPRVDVGMARDVSLDF